MTSRRSECDQLRDQVADLQAQLHATDVARLHAEALLDQIAADLQRLAGGAADMMNASPHLRGVGPDPYPHDTPDPLQTLDVRERISQVLRWAERVTRTSGQRQVYSSRMARTNVRVIADALGIEVEDHDV